MRVQCGQTNYVIFSLELYIYSYQLFPSDVVMLTSIHLPAVFNCGIISSGTKTTLLALFKHTQTARTIISTHSILLLHRYSQGYLATSTFRRPTT